MMMTYYAEVYMYVFVCLSVCLSFCMYVTFLKYFVGKIILGGGLIILEGGKMILTGGEIILECGKMILLMDHHHHQVMKSGIFWQTSSQTSYLSKKN